MRKGLLNYLYANNLFNAFSLGDGHGWKKTLTNCSCCGCPANVNKQTEFLCAIHAFGMSSRVSKEYLRVLVSHASQTWDNVRAS